MPPKDRQSEWEKRKAANREKAMQMPRVACSCGCGEMILALTSGGKPAKYKNGHAGPAFQAAQAKKPPALPLLVSIPRLSAPGACTTKNPDIFFGDNATKEGRDRTQRAISICEGCPVRDECLAWALDNPDLARGVWGGKTTPQRNAARRRRDMEQAA